MWFIKVEEVLNMLTRKQQELLLLVHNKLQEEGIPPSFEEMKVALSLKSKSGIHRLITALEERGFIRRLPNRARALEVIKLPDGYVDRSVSSISEAPASGGFHPNVIQGGVSMGDVSDESDSTNRGGLAARYGAASNPSVPHLTSIGGATFKGRDIPANDAGSGASQVPVMGRIAAGVPIAAIQEVTHAITVPPSMLGVGDHFALEVQGDSMINAGILSGDTVIIKRTNSAELGDIVVALVDDEEATLKRFRRENGKIALEAANPAYETRIFTPDRVKVQGKLIGLIREY